MGFLMRLARAQRGSNALEYGLILGFVSLAVAAGATATGSSLAVMFTAITPHITQVTTTITA